MAPTQLMRANAGEETERLAHERPVRDEFRKFQTEENRMRPQQQNRRMRGRNNNGGGGTTITTTTTARARIP